MWPPHRHLVLLCAAVVAATTAADTVVHIGTDLQDDVTTVHFTPKKSIKLTCFTTPESLNVTWEKNNKSVTDIDDLKSRVTIQNNILSIKDLKATDVGNYTCIGIVGDAKFRDDVTLVLINAIWGVKVQRNLNVVEEEPLSLKCEVRGELSLHWKFRNATGDRNWTDVTSAHERIKLSDYYDEDRKQNVSNGELKISHTNKQDRGEYRCFGSAADGESYNSTSMVRIKDKYAALWPFLGICAEVFILCAIIFVYEKKRNKTELEESDTDQSPDQKNTPDHGKESNLRHRQ